MGRIDDIYEVTLSNAAIEQLQYMPLYIKEKLYKWVEQIKLLGLSEVRKIKGYNDEVLKGKRLGQRSIRLNKAYRAIYLVQKDQSIKFVEIKEVSKHDY
jgi:proteic killer suppression protein